MNFRKTIQLWTIWKLIHVFQLKRWSRVWNFQWPINPKPLTSGRSPKFLNLINHTYYKMFMKWTIVWTFEHSYKLYPLPSAGRPAACDLRYPPLSADFASPPRPHYSSAVTSPALHEHPWTFNKLIQIIRFCVKLCKYIQIHTRGRINRRFFMLFYLFRVNEQSSTIYTFMASRLSGVEKQ